MFRIFVLGLFVQACTCIFAASDKPLRERYVDLIEQAVGAYSESRIQDYISRVEAEGITEHGFARLTANIGVLITTGRHADRKALFRRMMDICVREMPKARMRNSGHSAGNDFAVKEIALCLHELELSRALPESDLARWRHALSSMEAKDIYDCQPRIGDPTAHNWCVYGAASEQARIFVGIGGNSDYVNRYITDQLRFFDENGMYRDPGNPMVYDLVTRLQFATAMHCGYSGPARTGLEEMMLKSAEPTLRMQSVSGEIPYGGRSNQFLHNETFYAALCEWYASWFKQKGDLRKACRFRSAAKRAVDSLDRWLECSPVHHVKNRFPIDTKYGCEDYAYFDKYMITMGSWAYLALLFADESIGISDEYGQDGLFVTSDAFHRVMMNVGDYSLELDWAAQPEYDANGVGRLHRRGAPPMICLSTPCPSSRKSHYCLDVTNYAGFAIAPVGWKGGKPTIADGHLVVDKDGVVWDCVLKRDGIHMRLSGETDVSMQLPAFEMDGERRSEIVCSGKELKVAFDGWTCHYETNGLIHDSGRIYGNRNGHYRGFIVTANRSLEIRIYIERSDS